MHESRVPIVKTPAEPEWLEPGVRIEENYTELVIFQALRYCPCARINHQARASERVSDDAIRRSGPHEVLWHVDAAPVNEAGDHIAARIQLRDCSKFILVEPCLNQRPIHCLANPPIVPIDHILNQRTTRKLNRSQVAKGNVAVGRVLPADGPRRKFPVRRVGICSTSISE